MLSQDEIVRVSKTLDEDLQTMLEVLSPPEPLPPARVRVVTAAILRKWFVENWISKLGKSCDLKIELPVIDNSHIVENVVNKENCEFFLTGGVRLDAKMIWGVYASPHPAENKFNLSRPVRKLVSPSKFLKQPRLFFDGEWYRTEDIIKFVANKAGGIHFNLDSLTREQKILEQANGFLQMGNPNGETVSRLVENLDTNDQPRILLVLPKELGHTWNSTDIEMLSAAQSFINMHVDGQMYLPLPINAEGDHLSVKYEGKIQ